MIVDDAIVENPEFFLVSVLALDTDAEFEQGRDEATIHILDNDGKKFFEIILWKFGITSTVT